MNDNTEVRDELARLAGWTCPANRNIEDCWTHADGRVSAVCPIPNTLDEAAKLPEGWFYDVKKCPRSNGIAVFECNASPAHEDGGTSWECVSASGDTELAARFALRLAVEKIEHERRGGQP